MADDTICALYLVREGRDPFEAYRPDIEACSKAVGKNEFSYASVTKSIMSILFGATFVGASTEQSAQEGDDFKSKLEASVHELLGDGFDGIPRETTVRNFLNMNSGIDWDERNAGKPEYVIYYKTIQDEDGNAVASETLLEATKAFLADGGEFHPPRRYRYSSYNAQILANIIQLSGGMEDEAGDAVSLAPLAQAFEDVLWSRLSLPDGSKFRWKADFNMQPAGSCCAKASIETTAALGRFVLEAYNRAADHTDGDATSLDQWIFESIRNRVATGRGEYCSVGEFTPGVEYGFQWRVILTSSGDVDSFYAFGTGGQFLHVFPGENAVVVQHSSDAGFSDPTTICRSLRLHEQLVRS